MFRCSSIGFLLFFLLPGNCFIAEARLISVNVMEDIKPVAFINDERKPDGLYINLIEEIARLNNWSLSFSHDNWDEGMQWSAVGSTT